MRFHPTRGVSTISKSKGGYGPDSLCEEEDEVLVEMKRLIDTYHDNSRCSKQLCPQHVLFSALPDASGSTHVHVPQMQLL